jgi:hypothetical protein
MNERVTSKILVGALLRKAESEGGFGAVLEKGDPTAGAVLVVLLESGGNPRVLERVLQSDGRYVWQMTTNEVIENEEEVPRLIARRRRFDPDLWAIELDIPSAERFAAEMNSLC